MSKFFQVKNTGPAEERVPERRDVIIRPMKGLDRAERMVHYSSAEE